MRGAATLGSLWLVGISCAGCRWSTDVQEYASAVAQPTDADLVDPPEAQPLVCTDEGFTVVVGPEPGCAELEGVAGAGEISFDDPFFFDPSVPVSRERIGTATPIRVVRRGDRVADVEVVVRCRPFFNDERDFRLVVHRDTCESAEQILTSECGFGGRFDATLDTPRPLELWFAGEGSVVDVRACVRPDP